MNRTKDSRSGSVEATGHNSAHKQRTITDLFSANSTPKRGISEQLPSNKRQKIESAIEKSRTAPPIKRDAPNAAVNMYSFASSGSPINIGPPSDASKNGTRSNRFTPHTGARKLVVKNLKTKPRVDPDEYMNKSWTQLDDALTAILNNQSPKLSLEQLYKGAENICRLGKAPQLFENVKDKTDNYMTKVVLAELQEKAQSQDNIGLLRSINQAWISWNERLVSICDDSSFSGIQLTWDTGINSINILLSRSIIPDTLNGASGALGARPYTIPHPHIRQREAQGQSTRGDMYSDRSE